MCTHKNYITNKYTGQRMLVDCGICPACLQKKANDLTNRIRQHYFCGKRVMFLTLTYDRISCPYIKPEEVYNLSAGDPINVYREYRITHSRIKRNKRIYGETKLNSVIYDGYGLNKAMLPNIKPCVCLKHRPFYGVCYYKDFQDFFKRLRINLLRNYGITDKIDFFGCSEYGAKTKRPHFHAVLFVPTQIPIEEVLRPSVVSSWPFASKHRTSVGLEYPRKDVSAYVASYVNCTTSISTFLRGNFPPKRSFSKFFGAFTSDFNLPSLLEMFDRGDFTYYYTKSAFEGGAIAACVPTRIIARYFPKIKGYSRLSDTSLFELVTNYTRFLFYKERLGYRDDECQDDFTESYIRLSRGFRNFCNERNFSSDTPHLLKWADYMFYYDRIWSRYYAFKHKFLHMQYDKMNIPLNERYDNINEVFCGFIGDEGLVDVCSRVENPTINPNAFSSVVRQSAVLERYFWQRDKQKKVTNMINDLNGSYM